MDLTPDERKKYDHAQLEFLREVGRDLTRDAQTGKIKPVVGREQEIQLMIEVLCRETKSNPVPVGAVWLEYSMFSEHCGAKSFLSALRTITENARNYQQELKKRESAAITSRWVGDEAAEWLESKRFKKVR